MKSCNARVNFFLALTLGALVAGCAGSVTKSPEQIAADNQKKAIEDFEAANRLLDNKQYEEAAKAFDRMRVDNPTSQLDFFVIFNAGIAYQSLNDCATAAERYRQVIRVAKKSPRTQAMARVRLSDTLICLGDDKKAMVTLIEAYRDRKNLPPEIGEAEVPARLAAAYARDGNASMAQRYFKAAEAGLAQVRNSKRMPKEQRETMAKTLFLMGNMNQINPATVSSEDYFTTVKSLQKYLFRAVELNVPEWSTQASQQITEAYDKVWHYLDAVQPPESDDQGFARRQAKAQKVSVAKSALAALRELYKERVPDPQEPPTVKALLSDLRKQEAKIEGFMAMHVVGSEKTLEAEKFESVKREGRVKNPDPTLEKNK